MASETTRILMFHRVREDTPSAFCLPDSYRMRGTALTVDEFIHVIDGVGRVLSLNEVERALSRGEGPPVGSVLTFDDGYREHLDVVAPLLAQRGITATFYIATGLHGAGTDVAVVDAWYWLLDHAAERMAWVPMPTGGVHRERIDTHEGKSAWVGGAPKAALLATALPQQIAMIEALGESVGCVLPDDLATRLYLHPNEWSALVEVGMRVGAHSIRHPRLTQLDDSALHAEVHGSIDAVRRRGDPVAFAYPDGAYDDRVEREVVTAGALSAVTCESGTITQHTPLWRMPRIFISPEGVRSGAWRSLC